MEMAIYIIAPLVLVGVILLLIKIADRGAPTQEENEKRRKESEELIKFMEEHPEFKEQVWKEFFSQPHIKEMMKKILNNEQKQ